MARNSIIGWIVKKLKGNMALVEDSTTASQNISANKYVVFQGVLCTADAAISQGDTLATSGAGKNLTEVTGGGFNELNDNISTINGKLKFGTFESATLPYEAKSDGFIVIYLNPSSSSGAYARLTYSADGKNIFMGLNARSGDGVSLSYPVKKGATVSQAALSNGSLATNFLPIF